MYGEVAKDTFGCPCREVRTDAVWSAPRLQTKGVAAKVDAWLFGEVIILSTYLAYAVK